MNYETHAENGFKSLDRGQLREACKTLGLSVGPNEGDDSMRAKLCAAMGRAPDSAQKPKPAAAVKSSTSIPNLSPDGIWEGRWYYVTIISPNDKLTSCPVGWNGNYRNLPLGVEVKITAPHYNALTESVGETILQKKTKDEETGIERYEKVSREFREFIVSNARVDPETAHLPSDYVEFFRNLEREHTNFHRFGVKQLRAIYARLADHVKESEIVKLEEDVLRDRILALIKPGYGADILAIEDLEAA